MRAVLQRVKSAQVDIDGTCVGRCGKGFLVLLGVEVSDTAEQADILAAKIGKLRVFEDEAGKMNRSIVDVGGEFLVVSQFTLYANCRHGNRPDFLRAARPETAIPLYEYFMDKLRALSLPVEHGVFGADMQVTLQNDGPVTIILDTDEWKKTSEGKGGAL